MTHFSTKLALALAAILVPLLTSCSSSGTAQPKIESVITLPNPPLAGRIRFTLTGSGFDPNSIRAFFKGPGCNEPCEAPGNAIDARTASQISGLADLGAGPYDIMTRNGDGPMSNSVSITLIPAAPKH